MWDDNETVRSGLIQFAIGAVVCAIGGLITWATARAAEPGGSYVVMTGAIFFGALGAIRGLYLVFKGMQRGY